MKQVWSMLLIVCVLLAALSAGAVSTQAGTFVEDDPLEYYISNDEAILTQCMKTYVYNVTIRDKVNGYPVTRIKTDAFKNCYQLTRVDIPDSVRELQDKAFYRCFALETVSVPDRVTRIGKDAFLETALYEEPSNWDNGVLYIGSHLIKANNEVGGTYAIKSDTVTIADGAFEDCANLAAVTIPDRVTNIGLDAFANTGVTDVWYVGTENDRAAITINEGNDALNQATWHYNACNADHTYANACDTTCNECGFTRAVGGHVYDGKTDTACNECGVTRNLAKVTAQPKHTYTKLGSTAKVTVGATGDGLTYQWYIKNAGQAKYSKSSVTTATYSVKMSDKVKDRLLYCIITDQYGNSVRTQTVVMRMAASVATQPKSNQTQNGATAKVTVGAKGDGLKYQWYVKNAGQTKYSKSSITTATYSVKMSDKARDRYVYCIVTDKYGKTVKTNTVVLRMAASILTQPKTAYAKSGATVKTTVKAAGDGLKYQWYVKNDGATAYVKSSITTATYSAKMSSTVKNRRVLCIITDQYGNKVQTQTVMLKMK